METTSFGILGTTAMRIGGDMVDRWGKPRERRLLGVLLVHSGRLVSLETLVAWMWDAAEPQHPRQTFHTYISNIRKALRENPAPAVLRVQNGQFLLEVDKSEVDHHRFRELFTEARGAERSGQLERAVALVDRALALWRGLPLADLAGARADAWRTQFVHNVWLPANLLPVRASIASARFDDALERLDELQADHPSHISMVMLRISTLLGLDRSAEAVAYYLQMHQYFRGESDDHAADRLRLHYDEIVTGKAGVTGSELRRPVAQPPRQLPHNIVDFTGREELLAALDVASSADNGMISGVVIVDGMAGVGKTALVVRWGHRVRERFPDGTLFVNLGGYARGVKIEQAAAVDDFLISLGFAPDSTMTRRARDLQLSRLLAGRRMLVILDNAEDVSHVDGLVRLLSNSLVVVTSRHRLGSLATSIGARRVRVGPMSSEEGLMLLRRRFGSHVRVDRDRCERLVRMCEGLPLAITLLADHLGRAPAAELSGFVDGLDSRRLLTEIGESGENGLRLSVLFSYSYLALGVPERRLFRLLALHPGPDLGIDIACAYDGRAREHTVSSLNALISAHLLEEPKEFERYRYHDLVREFAIECFELEEDPVVAREAEERAFAYYLESARNALTLLYPSEMLAPRLTTAPLVRATEFLDRGAARTWFDRERTNLSAIIDHAARQGWATYTWQLADPVATYFDRRGYFVDSIAVRRFAVDAARADGHLGAEASSLLGLGIVLLTVARHREATECVASARRLYEQIGNERGVAATIHQSGRAEMLRDRPGVALRFFRECLEISERIDDAESICWSHRSLGEAYRATEQYEQALVHLREAAWRARRTSDASAYGSTMTLLASTYRDCGDLLSASAHCEKALTVAEEDLVVAAQVRVEQCEIAIAQGDLKAAIRWGHMAVRLCANDNVAEEAKALEVLGNAYYGDAELQHAAVNWHSAYAFYRQLGNTTKATLVQGKLGGLPSGDANLPRSRSESWRAPNSIE